MLDVAFDTMSGDEGLAEAMRDDGKHCDWLAGMETKLEEKRQGKIEERCNSQTNANQNGYPEKH
jgi:hypothetical protein